LQALQTLIGSIEKADHGRSIARARRAGGWRASPELVLSGHAIAATVLIPKVFDRVVTFAAWIGLVPREDSTGGKQKPGRSRNRANATCGRILVVGACAVLRYARQQPEKYPWLTQLLARKPFKGRGGGACQQDGAHCLGVAGQGRTYRAPALAAAA
jgi:transposase